MSWIDHYYIPVYTQRKDTTQSFHIIRLPISVLKTLGPMNSSLEMTPVQRISTTQD